MSIEIERKFLVEDPTIIVTTPHSSYVIYQYYIDENMRIRVVSHSDGSTRAYMTIKHPLKDMMRKEWEFEIDVDLAEQYYGDLKYEKVGIGSIKKTRHIINDPDSCKEFSTWEIDVFHGDNEGLILAEIELQWEDGEFNIMKCLGREVTNDKRYYNSYLAKNPYTTWEEESK